MRETPGSVANQGVEAHCIFATFDHVCAKMDVAAVVTTTGWQQQSAVRTASAQEWCARSHVALGRAAAIETTPPTVKVGAPVEN